MAEQQSYFIPFKRTIKPSELPEKFTYPFYYEPHPLCIEACEELMQYIETQLSGIAHNFGLDEEKGGLEIGKMFGVLLVENKKGEIGYLRAFSGKLANSNNHKGFVPSIFDMLAPNGFFVKGEEALNQLNRTIEAREDDSTFLENKAALSQALSDAEQEITNYKAFMKGAKAVRAQKRQAAGGELNSSVYDALCQQLIKESYSHQYELKVLQQKWKDIIEHLKKVVSVHEDAVNSLKQHRKEKSNALQQRLFDQYNFLNKDGKRRNVRDIFADTAIQNPPSGAGECATPKMLQYAFQSGLKPLAMAEFWWGKSPVSEIRKHRQYYPACRGKCLPILNHMLEGMVIDENPMLVQKSLDTELEIVYEDEHIVVVNKEAEFLSVPGIHIKESVLDILQRKYPDATGPLLVHRLDMSTSGLLVAAKTKEAHQNIQAQFIRKTIKKRYVALLDGIVEAKSGIIELPLRVDLDNRPFQLVCYAYGKPAKTKWELIEHSDGKSRVYFYPITGRTHQLRVHAAHPSGLNTPIVGDDLYGTKANRLHLHAEFLEIKHPVSRELVSFHCPAPF